MAAAYRWIVDAGHNCCRGDRFPVEGPAGLDRAIQTNPVEFRMFDGDGELYYSGWLYGDWTGFEPLEDFGLPNAGCTRIDHKTNGVWETL